MCFLKRTEYRKTEHNIKILTYLKMESQKEERNEVDRQLKWL